MEISTDKVMVCELPKGHSGPHRADGWRPAPQAHSDGAGLSYPLSTQRRTDR